MQVYVGLREGVLVHVITFTCMACRPYRALRTANETHIQQSAQQGKAVCSASSQRRDRTSYLKDVRHGLEGGL